MLKKNNLFLALIFILTVGVIVAVMPHDSRTRYHYEQNRPWSYGLLTAPFDVTIYRDSATIHRLTDSINAVFSPIYRRSSEPLADIRRAVDNNDSLPAAFRSGLISALTRVYSRGVVDQQTAEYIASSGVREIRFLEGNNNVARSTAQLMSRRNAYRYLDSLFTARGEHKLFMHASLAEILEPNVVRDSAATELYRQSLMQPVLSGIGVIQKGERIIAQGDIVTPQLYQILKTYEATLERHTGYNRSRMINTIIGQVCMVSLALGLVYAFLFFYYPAVFARWRKVVPILALLAVFFVISALLSGAFRVGIYLVPIACVPVILTVFYDSRTAFFVYAVEVLLCGLMAAYPLEYIFVQLVAGAAVIFSLRQLSRRSELLRSAMVALGAYMLAYLAFELMATGSLTGVSWRLLGFLAINSLLISFAYILIFVMEKLFNMVSVVTLVELSDINNDLLRRLSQECPGTFQHSMAVSNLVTDAAHRIGANVQLLRAGALYHDIGKIKNPAFFTENQHGVNPHDALTPEQSAGIIIRHITDGMKLAEKAQLPRPIRDLITQHHGAGQAKYFYNTALRNADGKPVDPAPYTYPGPNPTTREASLLMMADTVEAASRSMTDHSEEAIKALVNRLIDAQVADGLHNQSPISFLDIAKIKESFIARLRSMYHARISYPSAPKTSDK